MSKTIKTSDSGDLLCDLKAAVAALECQQKMQLLKEKSRRRAKKDSEPRMCIMIPLDQTTRDERNGDCEDKITKTCKNRRNHESHNSDEKTESVASSGDRRTHVHQRENREYVPKLRSGIIHSRCYCIHRNGLQDFCPISDCQGHPDCMTSPWAECPPARDFRSRFPELCPDPPNSDSLKF